MSKVQMQDIMSQVDKDSAYLEELVDDIVNSSCSKLDEYVEYISKIIADPDYNLTNTELDDIIMTIPTMLYFIGDQREKIGIKYNVAKASRNYMASSLLRDTESEVDGKKRTVTERKAEVDASLFYEDQVITVYETARDIIEKKLNYSTELLQSAKKIMSRRISETELSRLTPNRERKD